MQTFPFYLGILFFISHVVAFRPVQTGVLSGYRAQSAKYLFGGDNNKPAPKQGDGKKDAGGLFGGMGNMMDAMKKAQVRNYRC